MISEGRPPNLAIAILALAPGPPTIKRELLHLILEMVIIKLIINLERELFSLAQEPAEGGI